MNDLERELKELFESKASDVRTAPHAPAQVLRHGRRRQVGTVVSGAVMAVAATALVIGGASAFLADRSDAPPMGEGNVLGPRTATIGGVTVAAPEGWSLLDQWPLGQTIPTEVCTSSGSGTIGPDGSFSDVGTPVGSDGSGDQPPATDPTTEECVPTDVPGGVPLFTLANVEPNPVQTVCGLSSDATPQAVGATDAYLYVALDVSDLAPAPQWPTTLEQTVGSTCSAEMSARWSSGGRTYLAEAVFGAEVSEADRQTVLDAFFQLAFTGNPKPSFAVPGPGYVVAAGVQDGVTWRLEPAVGMTCQSGGACAVQLVLITTDDAGGEQAWPIVPPTQGTPLIAASQPLGGTTLVYGAADPSVETLVVTATDGTAIAPSSIEWPSALEAFASPEAPVDGTIWWALIDEPASVNATLVDGTTYRTQLGERHWSTASGSPSVDPAEVPGGVVTDRAIVGQGAHPKAGPWTVEASLIDLGDGLGPVPNLGLSFAEQGGSYGTAQPLEGAVFRGFQTSLRSPNMSGPIVPLEIFGPVTRDAARVVFEPAHQGEPIEAQLFPIPERFLGPARAFVVLLDDPNIMKPRGDLIAYAADGRELGRTWVGPTREPGGITPEIDAAVQDLSAVRDAIASPPGFDDLDLAAVATEAGVDLAIGTDPSIADVVIAVEDDTHAVLLARLPDGQTLCLGVENGTSFRYGVGVATTYQGCAGGWDGFLLPPDP